MQAAEATEPADPHATNALARSGGELPATESLEIERKYEVGADTQLPDDEVFLAASLTPGARETVHMIAEYFDTSDARLARARLAMRKRQGGTDEGWHLKEKGAAGTRELHWPLSDEIPEGLFRELRERIGDAANDLRPIAILRTERRILRLLSAAGAAGAAGGARVAGAASAATELTEVVELVDDRVHAVELRPDGSRVDRAWREWEAELTQGADPDHLDRAERVLIGAGAEPSLSTAKIARATGRLVEAAQASGASSAVIERLQTMDRIDREAARKLTP